MDEYGTFDDGIEPDTIIGDTLEAAGTPDPPTAEEETHGD